MHAYIMRSHEVRIIYPIAHSDGCYEEHDMQIHEFMAEDAPASRQISEPWPHLKRASGPDEAGRMLMISDLFPIRGIRHDIPCRHPAAGWPYILMRGHIADIRIAESSRLERCLACPDPLHADSIAIAVQIGDAPENRILR